MKEKYLICAIVLVSLLLSACGAASVGSGKMQGQKNQADAMAAVGERYSMSEYLLPEGTVECVIVGEKPYYRIFRPPFYYAVSDGENILFEANRLFWGMTSISDSVLYLENRPEGSNDRFFLTVIPVNGQENRTIIIKDVPDSFGRVKQIYSYGGEILVQYENQTIGILAADGGISKWLDIPKEYASYRVCYPYLVGENPDGNDLYTLDGESFELRFAFSTGRGTAFPGPEKDSLLLASDSGIDRVWNGGSTPFINWEACSIAVSGIHCFQSMGDGNYLLHDREGFKLLRPAKPGEVRQKTRLTIASATPDSPLLRFTAGFNANNDQYYVTIRDYSENGSYDKETALLRLNTEIISGRSPDMISVSSVSPYPFMRKGLLENLTDFLKTDDEIRIEDISVANALQRSGGIYFLGSDFSIETLEGLYSRFGDRNGWTLEEYLEMEKMLPSDVMTIYNMTFETLLQRMIPQYAQQAVDWSNVTCDFDNATFISLLKLGKQMRETPEDPNNLMFGSGAALVSAGKLITAATMATQVWSFAQQEKEAGDRLSFIGWPTVDGRCGSEIYLFSPVGILTTGGNQEGCWQFIKYMLTHTSGGLPVYLPALKEEIKSAQNNKDLAVDFTEEDAEKLLDMVSRQENVKIYDEVLMGIIQNECNTFFYGTKTAEETARIVQSKVSLYLSEQQ